MKPLRSRHTLPAAIALKKFGAEALKVPIIAKEVARFVAQKETISNRHIRSLSFDAATANAANVLSVIADEMFLASSLR